VADQRSSIELTTLAEVQRLLASTDFASIDDLARRTGAIDLGGAAGRAASAGGRPAPAAVIDPAGPTPLPRRR
jgi:hypothetical protein